MRKDPAERFPDLARMRSQLEEVLRELTEEAQRLRARVGDQHGQLLELRAALAERTGPSRQDEPVPTVDERARLATLQALERDLSARIEALQARITRADSLAPALRRATALLEAGQWADAVGQFEAIVAEMPEHARALDGLEQARAHIEGERRRQLAAKLAQDAREALEEARRAAQSLAGPQHARALWNEAEVKATEAAAALAREAYGEARESFEAAITLYRRVEAAAGEAQRREREAAEQAREQAAQRRRRAQAQGAPQCAREPWDAAEAKSAEAQTAYIQRAYGRAGEIFNEASNLYGRAEAAAAAYRRAEAVAREAEQRQAVEETIRQSERALDSPAVLAEPAVLIGASPALDGPPVRGCLPARCVCRGDAAAGRRHNRGARERPGSQLPTSMRRCRDRDGV